jgi:hypothetical protein
MKLERKVYMTRSEKVLDFVIGFVGSFLLNGLLYGCSYSILTAMSSNITDTLVALLLGLLPLLLNIAALILSAFTRRWIALGILVAFALVLVGVLLLGLVFYVICFNEGMFR